MNILLIIIDALRTKNLNVYGYPLETSPNIRRIAERGIVFENAFSCTDCTDPSLTSILSGRYPLSHGITAQGPEVKREHLRNLTMSQTVFLQEILKEKGYVTVAIDWLGRWHKKGYDYYTGEYKSYSAKPAKVLDKRWWYHHVISKLPGFLVKTVQILYREFKGYEVTNRAIDFLRTFKDKKFFMLIHYWSTHTPYTHYPKWSRKYRDYYRIEPWEVPIDAVLDKIKNEKYRDYLKRLVSGANRVGELVRRYDEAIAFTDKQVGEITKFLEENGLLEDTLVIVTSDHGESLVEHGIYFSHHGLYDEVIKVPLILSHPDLPKNIRIKGFIQHCDLVPTILDLLGIKLKLPLDGVSALPLIYDGKDIREEVYAMGGYEWENGKIAIRNHDYKYIYTPPEKLVCKLCGYKHGDVHELYNIKIDPLERENIYEKEPKVGLEMKMKIKRFLKTLTIRKYKYVMARKVKKAFQSRCGELKTR